MYNLIIDLEMCNVTRDYRQRSYKYANETIQIGAVLLDENFKRISTLCQYVHPEYGAIDHFIEPLTGWETASIRSMHGVNQTELRLYMRLKKRKSRAKKFLLL